LTLTYDTADERALVVREWFYHRNLVTSQATLYNLSVDPIAQHPVNGDPALIARLRRTYDTVFPDR
jgi:hypothetical protein